MTGPRCHSTSPDGGGRRRQIDQNPNLSAARHPGDDVVTACMAGRPGIRSSHGIRPGVLLAAAAQAPRFWDRENSTLIAASARRPTGDFFVTRSSLASGRRELNLSPGSAARVMADWRSTSPLKPSASWQSATSFTGRDIRAGAGTSYLNIQRLWRSRRHGLAHF